MFPTGTCRHGRGSVHVSFDSLQLALLDPDLEGCALDHVFQQIYFFILFHYSRLQLLDFFLDRVGLPGFPLSFLFWLLHGLNHGCMRVFISYRRQSEGSAIVFLLELK